MIWRYLGRKSSYQFENFLKENRFLNALAVKYMEHSLSSFLILKKRVLKRECYVGKVCVPKTKGLFR